jgi:CheY-like chemotaxis protein
VTASEFANQVGDAFGHLYDLVYLRRHPLLDKLLPSAAEPDKRRARQLHRILLDVIAELDPGPQAPTLSHEWRRHRLMVWRYVNGQSAQTVADRLVVSLRHYYRLQSAALDDVAHILWERYVANPPESPAASEAAESDAELGRLEMLRLEAARMAQADRYTRVADVVRGVVPLLDDMLRARRLYVRTEAAADLPGVSVDQPLLRQMLLGALDYLIERAKDATLSLVVQARGAAARVSLRVEPPEGVVPPGALEAEDRVSALSEMAALAAAQVTPVYAGDAIVGFDLALPIAERTVMVVDDNEDVLELFRSYLYPHRYRVVTVRSARQVLDIARETQPYAITLDLMMPGQDGWDVLQTLLNQPDTRHIPVIVCTVLRQKELALSLGAAAFLPKPVTESALLSVLESLEER